MRELMNAVCTRCASFAAVLICGFGGVVGVGGVEALCPQALAQDEVVPSNIEFAPSDDVGPPAPSSASEAPAPQATEGAASEAVKETQVAPAPKADAEIPGPQPQSSSTEPPKPEAIAPSVKPENDGEEKRIYRRGESRDDGILGTYRVRLMYGKPTFRDHMRFYDQLYGSAKAYPEIAIDWFAWNWYATLGLSFRFGYYSDDGHAAKVTGASADNISSVDSSNISPDLNGPTSLTLIPLQLLFTIETTPFPKKWIVLDGWAGIEHLYYQETRSQNQSTSSTSTGTSTTSTTQTTTKSSLALARPRLVGALLPSSGEITLSKDTTLTNTGWRNAIVVGAAANILLNGLDEQATASLRNIGIGGIYLSPYLEWIRTIGLPSGSTLSFGRTVMGLAFTFESLH